MNALKLVLAIMIMALTSHATIRTVNNNGNAQFYNIEDAVVASSPGDTIYIHGSASYYCYPTTVKNNITYIGPGFNPDKQLPFTAFVTCGGWVIGQGSVVIGIDIDNLAQNGDYSGSGSSVQGLRSLTFKRCRIRNYSPPCHGYGDYSWTGGVLFIDCIIQKTLLSHNNYCNNNSYAVGCTFYNCLFYDAGLIDNITNTISNIVVENCIFYKTGSTSNAVNNSNGSAGIIFTNNIFVNQNIGNGSTNIVYLNNYSTTENLNINIGSGGNLQGANPLFMNAPGGTFSFTHNYHLASGSPCIGTGLGGIDMGIYSGNLPMIWSGHPPIPQIDFFNIIGSTVPQNGNINITFQSTVKN